jgi:integrase
MVRLNVKRGYEHVPVGGALVLGRTKTTASVRIVPMIAPVEAALRQHRARQPFNEYDLVWATDEGRAIHPRVDHRSWKRALDLAELPPVPLHSTRHTAATLLQGLKVTEAVRMKIVGHNSQSQHREYAHVDMTLMREALETYGDVLELTA